MYGQTPISTFQFIVRSAQNRPRDFIRYIRDCAQTAIEEELDYIDANMVRKIEKKFSQYLRSELVDEMSSLVPEIDEIFNVLSSIGKDHFNTKNFCYAYETYFDNKTTPNYEPKKILEILFTFNIIGQINRSGKRFFKYLDQTSQCNFESPFCIHRGLFKAIQIL